MTDIQTSNITNNTDTEPVTKGFLIEFMTEFKIDLFEMLDIRFEKIDSRFEKLEKTVSQNSTQIESHTQELVKINTRLDAANKKIDETNRMLENQIATHTIDHMKFDSRIHTLEQASA
ncbi:hypothetical protein KAZ66_04200 [Candidatus Woesebacteria bacterium]|nr:hypothetical protein [Candidatus Woesebacteria bacterium]